MRITTQEGSITVGGTPSQPPYLMWPSYVDTTSYSFMWWVPQSQLSWNQASFTAVMTGNTTLNVTAVASGNLYVGDTIVVPGGPTGLVVTGTQNTGAANGGVGLYTMNTAATFASTPGISKIVGQIPDYYIVYKDGIPFNFNPPPTLTNPGVTASPIEAPNGRAMSWFTETGLSPGESHVYTVASVTSGAVSAQGPSLTMKTLAAQTTQLPTAPVEPNTWIQALQIPAVTAVVCNTQADFTAALNNANPAGPNLIVLTAGNTFAVPTFAGWNMQTSGGTFTGTSGWTYIISSETPEYKTGGKLPAFNFSQMQVGLTVINCTAAIAAGSSTATLAPNQSGFTDSSGNWIAKSGWYHVVFTEPTIVQTNGSLHEERLCVFTNGAPTFTWANHNANYTGGVGLTAQANATIQVMYLTGVTPWDANDNAAMPKLDIGAIQGGIGINIPAACTKVRFIGINVHTGPNTTTGATGFVKFANPSVGQGIGADTTGLGDGTIPAESIYFDRCVMGSQGGDTDFGYAQHGIGWLNVNHFLVHQCYLFGIVGPPNGGDANNFGCNGQFHCVQNSYLQAVGENWIYGGIGTSFANPPSDIVFRYNASHKPLDWFVGAVDGTSNGGVAPYSNFGKNVKNHFELKTGFRVAYYGNLLLNNCTANQASYRGAGFAFGARTPQGPHVDRAGGCPWMQVQDVECRNNLIYRCSTPIVSFSGEQTPTSLDARIWFHNNQYYVSPPLTQNERLYGYYLFGPSVDHIYESNTGIVNNAATFNQGVPMGFYFVTGIGAGNPGSSVYNGAPSTPGNWHTYQDRFTFRNNIVDEGGTNWGFHSDGGLIAPWTMPNVTFAQNVTINDSATYSGSSTIVNVLYTGITAAFKNYQGNQTIPLQPSDWNVVSGTLATASTTGGPVGCIFGAPTITTTTLPAATVGTAYSQQILATGGTPPYVWTMVSALPNWNNQFVLSATGLLTSNPLPQMVETDQLVIKVQDSLNAAATATFNLTVNHQ